MRSTWALSVLLAAGAGIAATAPDPSAEEILSGAAPAIDYTKSVKCLASLRLDRVEPLDERFVVFHVGAELWLAQLHGRCPGLRGDSQLLFEKRNERICRWDTFRIVYDDGIGNGARFGPSCQLPEFEPVSAEQVAMLKQHLEATRRTGKSPQ